MDNLLQYFYSYIPKEIDEEQNLIKLFLFLIGSLKEDFYKNFENNLYPIYANIVSFIDNPNCSCRHKIAEYITSNYSEFYNLMEDWIKNNNDSNSNFYVNSFFEKLKLKQSKIEIFKKFKVEPEENIFRQLIGKVITIEDSPHEFENLILYLKSNKYYYNNISIIKDLNNKLKIYFV